MGMTVSYNHNANKQNKTKQTNKQTNNTNKQHKQTNNTNKQLT